VAAAQREQGGRSATKFRGLREDVAGRARPRRPDRDDYTQILRDHINPKFGACR